LAYVGFGSHFENLTSLWPSHFTMYLNKNKFVVLNFVDKSNDIEYNARIIISENFVGK